MLVDNLADLVILGQAKFDSIADKLKLPVAKAIIKKGWKQMLPEEYVRANDL